MADSEPLERGDLVLILTDSGLPWIPAGAEGVVHSRCTCPSGILEPTFAVTVGRLLCCYHRPELRKRKPPPDWNAMTRTTQKPQEVDA